MLYAIASRSLFQRNDQIRAIEATETVAYPHGLQFTGMRLLQKRGATSIFLETQQGNAAALHLFTSVGFRVVSAWQWMTKEIAPTE